MSVASQRLRDGRVVARRLQRDSSPGAGCGPRPTRSATAMPSGAIGDCGSSPRVRATSFAGSRCTSLPSSSTWPLRGAQQPRHRAQQRRLAAGVGADDRGDPPGRHGEVERRRRRRGRRSRGSAARRRASGWRSQRASRAVGADEQVDEVRRAEHAGDDADGVAGAEGVLADRSATSTSSGADQRRPAPAASRPAPTSRAAIGPARNATNAIGPAAAVAKAIEADGRDDDDDPGAFDAGRRARPRCRRRAAAGEVAAGASSTGATTTTARASGSDRVPGRRR